MDPKSTYLGIQVYDDHISIDNSAVELRRKEFQLLKYFLENKETFLKKTEIYQKVWGTEVVDDRTLNVQLCHLRKKLGEYSPLISSVFKDGEWGFYFGKDAPENTKNTFTPLENKINTYFEKNQDSNIRTEEIAQEIYNLITDNTIRNTTRLISEIMKKLPESNIIRIKEKTYKKTSNKNIKSEVA
ncbi:MAG: winged helix-turn-helix domain-containing protein [Candidatus Woesearchaeota archaeon]